MVKFQKKEFRAAVLNDTNKNVQRLIIAEADLYQDSKGIEWKENNKEVVIKNQYYEVLSVQKDGGNYIVNIIEDKRENELFKNYFDQTDLGNKLGDHLLVVLALQFILPEPSICLKMKSETFLHNKFVSKYFPSGFYLIDLKPPRI